MKRMLALLLALSMLLCACGAETGGESVQSAAVTEENAAEESSDAAPYYSVTYQEAGAALSEAITWDMVWTEPGTVGENSGLLYTVDDGTGDYTARSLRWAEPYDEEGTILLSLTGDEAIDCFCLGGDGYIYAVVSEQLEDYLEADDGYTRSGHANARLVCLDASGAVQWELTLEPGGDNSYSEIAVSADGEIYLCHGVFDPEKGYFANGTLEQYTRSGLAASMTGPEATGSGSGSITGFLTAQDGTLLLEAQVNDNPRLYVLDMEDMGEPLYEYTESMSWPTLYSGGSGADYYILDDTGLTGGSLDGETWTYFHRSDLPATVPDYAYLGAVLGESSFLYYVTVLGTLYFVEITGQWEPVEETEKIQLTLGTAHEYAGNINLETLVVAFNILNPEYNLALRTYREDQTLGADDVQEALNLDILNGQGPDILVMDSYYIPCSAYAGNGYLMDLYPLMDADTEFQRSDYYENIWQACELNGSLYGVVKTFSLFTLYTSTDYVQVPDGWTPTECQEIAAQSSIPLGLSLGGSTQNYMNEWQMSYILGDYLQAYIDGDTCDFTSGEFAALLELLAAQEPEADYEPETLEEYFQVKNGVYLTNTTVLWGVHSLLEQKIECGENYAITGYPSPDRAPVTVVVDSAFGISQVTEYPEAAWSFLKLVLEAQGVFNDWFTTEKSAMEEQLREYSVLSEDAEPYEMTYGWNDESVDVTADPLTQEEVEQFQDLLENAQCSLVDADIRQIVQEEVAAFFSGDKTADQVAEIIQNRVQLHLWEIS